MEAEQIQSTLEEERTRQTVAYPVRNEEDYERLLEEMEEVESEEVAEAVEDISEVVDGQLRNVVGNHFQAPIRSLNNPGENSLELEDGTEAQIVGEEYSSVNGNLPGFMDVSNIKWWTVYDEGTYREERRADMQGEHLQFNSDGDLHGFRVELDGEPVETSDVQRLARNLRIRRDSRVLDENRVPEFVLNYQNPEEVVESEDLSRQEFEESYEEAEKLGLITPKGNITLKGWLSAANMEAQDLREFERINESTENVAFPNLARTDLENITETEAVGKSGTITVDVNLPGSDVTLASQNYRGDVIYENGEKEVQGFGPLPEFLDKNGSDLLQRFNEVTVNDVFGNSGAIEVTPSSLEQLGIDQELESRPVESYLRDLIEDQIREGRQSVGTNEYEPVLEILESDAAELKDVQYRMNSEVEFEGPLSHKAPMDRIREEFDLSRIEREVREMMSSYEMEVMPDDFDHTNGNSGKSVEMNLEHDSLAAEYCHASSGGPWPLRDTSTRDGIAEFYITGSNLFSIDKADIELYPFLVDQIKEEIESQGGSVETVDSGAIRIHNYEDLDNQTREKLDLIEESTYRSWNDEDEGTITYIDGSKLEFERRPEVEIDLQPAGYLEVETEAEIESRTYTNTEEIQRIAEALDPMNFEKTPYNQIAFETDFEYETG